MPQKPCPISWHLPNDIAKIWEYPPGGVHRRGGTLGPYHFGLLCRYAHVQITFFFDLHAVCSFGPVNENAIFYTQETRRQQQQEAALKRQQQVRLKLMINNNCSGDYRDVHTLIG